MTTIKKVFHEVNALLSSNQDKLVSELMPELLQLMQTKVGGSDVGATSYKDAEGNVIAVYCYYHKQWELVSEHVYGEKKGTTTGLNSMCKAGVNAWTKQQREAKQASTNLLNLLSSGNLTLEALPETKAIIEEKRNSIIFGETYPRAFDSLDSLKEFLEADQAVEEVVKINTKKAKAKKTV